MKKIDFEAHFYTEAYIQALYNNRDYPCLAEDKQLNLTRLWYNAKIGQPFAAPLLHKLINLDQDRLKIMDSVGIDIQVLSLSAPGIEQLDSKTGIDQAAASNDFLAELISKHPDRFMGYAALATKKPKQAAAELERAVKELGLIGWNTHSNYGDSYLDDKKYLPILEMAEQLDVPVYIHPTVSAISQLADYGFALAGAPFGFGIETALCLMRMIYAGVFDKLPKLKIILGHLGEGLPFIFKRIDWAFERPFNPAARPDIAKKPSDYLKENVFITTSGNHYQPAFKCALEAMGIDRILFGSDYPYEDSKECNDFIEGLPLSSADREKLYYRNAERFGIVL